MRRYITKEQIETLSAGTSIDLRLSPKRVLTLDPKTEQERALERLEAKFEAERAKITGVAGDIVEATVDTNINE